MNTSTKLMAMFLVIAMVATGFMVVSDSTRSDASGTSVNPTDVFNGTTTEYARYDSATATYTILQDLAFTSSKEISDGSTLNIDLNGHDIFASEKTFILTHGTLNLTGSGVVYESSNDKYAPVYIKGSLTSTDNDYSVLNVGEKVILRGWSGVFITPYSTNEAERHAYGVVVNLEGTARSPGMDGHAKEGHGIYINGYIQDNTGNIPQINITKTGKVINPKGHAIFSAGSAIWNIAGTVSGLSGLEIKAGGCNVNIEDSATITATSSTTTHVKNGNGPSTTGYSIAVVENSGYGGSPTLNFSNGTLVGPVALVADDIVSSEKKGAIIIAGGTVKGTISLVNTSESGGTSPVGSIVITGGTFSADPSGFVPEGYTTILDDDGNYKVGKKCTVTFDSNGGSAVGSITTISGQTIDEPEEPTYEGKVFKGWFTTSELKKEYNFDDPVTSDMTLYAKWSDVPAEAYIVTFDSNGGSSVHSQAVAKGLAVERPDDPVKENNRFAGWYTSSALTERYVFSTPVESDMTLYAKWTTIATVSIPESDSFVVTDTSGNPIKSQTVNAGTTFQFKVQLSSGYTDLDVYINDEEEPLEPAGGIYSVTVNNDVSMVIMVSIDGTTEISEETYVENDDGSTTETSTKMIVIEKGTSHEVTISETQATTGAGVTSTVTTVANIDEYASATVTMTVSGAEEATLSGSMADILAFAPVISIDTNVSKVNMPSELINNPKVQSVTVSVNSGSDNSARITIPVGVIPAEKMSENISIEVSSSSSTPSSIGGSIAIPAFDLTLNGTTTTSFVTDVTVSYDVELPNDARNVRAYCIDTGEFMTATYVNGVATFSVPHFSSWTIVYDKPVIVVEDDDDILFILEQQRKAREAAEAASQTTTGDDSGEEAAVIIAAAAVAGAMLACAFFAFRRP